MTDKEGGRYSEAVTYLGVGIVLIITIISIAFFYSVLFGDGIILFGGGSAEYAVICDKYDGELRTRWLLSDNITGYDDIPDSQKENLSNSSREVLKRANPSYNATNFTELSEGQKEIFIEAINGSAVTENESNTPYVRIFYRGEMYSCDTDVYVPGA
jgi:hypothetical protein